MSTVGILSMQRVDNYGSIWQAYCLKNLIESLGNSVEFIDIKPGFVDTITPHRPRFSIKKIKRIPYYLFQWRKHRLFKKARLELLGLSDSWNYSEDYDTIIIGSDEVFNCAQQSSWGLSLQLFGRMNNRNINTYAASFGNTTIEAINQKYKTDIQEALMHIRNISVRDNNSHRIIMEMTGRDSTIHLDPVLIGDLPMPENRENEEDYILLYAYDFRIKDPSIIKEIVHIAHEEKLQIISLGFFHNWVDKNIIVSPLKALSIIRNAKYVVTDTFHGTIFSIRYQKRFAVIVQRENTGKLQDLIYRLDIGAVYFTTSNSLNEILHSTLDYGRIERLININKHRTVDYLKMCTSI